MKNLRSFLLVMAALAFAASFAVAQSKDDGGLKALDAKWRTAMLAGDLDAVVACYAENAVMRDPHGTEQQGRAAIRASYKEWLDASKIDQVTFSGTRYETSGNLACAWGNVTIAMTPKAGGAPTTMEAYFTTIGKREKGQWAYVVDHVSPAGATAATAPGTSATPPKPGD